MSVKFLTPIYFSFPALSKPFQNNPSNYFSLQPNILQSFGELGQLLKKKNLFCSRHLKDVTIRYPFTPKRTVKYLSLYWINAKRVYQFHLLFILYPNSPFRRYRINQKKLTGMRSKDTAKNYEKKVHRYSKIGNDLLIIIFDPNQFANFLIPKISNSSRKLGIKKIFFLKVGRARHLREIYVYTEIDFNQIDSL